MPLGLAAGLTQKGLTRRIGALPVATSIGGQFREQLENSAAKAKWPLRVSLSCSSFTQAARAAQSGAFAAVLPGIAVGEIGSMERFALPFLQSYSRELCLAWNPRLVSVRASLRDAIEALSAALADVCTGPR